MLVAPGVVGLDGGHFKAGIGIGGHGCWRRLRLGDLPGGLWRRASEDKGKRVAALAGSTVDGFSIGAQLSFVGEVEEFENQFHVLPCQGDGIEIDRLSALIEAVEDSLVSAFIILRDFDDGAQILAGVERALPCIGDVVRRGGRGLSGRGSGLGCVNGLQVTSAGGENKDDGREGTRGKQNSLTKA